MLSERNQTQKATYYMIPFIGNAQNRQIQGQKVDLWLPRTGGRGKWEMTADGYGVS